MGRAVSATGNALLLPFQMTLIAALASTQWLADWRRRRGTPPA